STPFPYTTLFRSSVCRPSGQLVSVRANVSFAKSTTHRPCRVEELRRASGQKGLKGHSSITRSTELGDKTIGGFDVGSGRPRLLMNRPGKQADFVCCSRLVAIIDRHRECQFRVAWRVSVFSHEHDTVRP